MLCWSDVHLAAAYIWTLQTDGKIYLSCKQVHLDAEVLQSKYSYIGFDDTKQRKTETVKLLPSFKWNAKYIFEVM